MPTVVLSSKGQAVIPQEFREEFKWKKGTKLNVQKTFRGVMFFSVPEKPLSAIRGMLQKTKVSKAAVKAMRKNDFLMDERGKK